MPTSQEVDNLRNETMASVNSRFAVVTEEEILQIITVLEHRVCIRYAAVEPPLTNSNVFFDPAKITVKSCVEYRTSI